MNINTKTFRERNDLAEDPNTYEDDLRELAQDIDWGIRLQVACNPSTPSAVLQDLARRSYKDTEDKDEMRYYVAGNPNTPKDILYELSKDANNTDARVKVADNTSTPSTLLRDLAKDPAWEVRSSVGANLNTSIKVLYKLATDENSLVRNNVAANINSSSKILVVILEHEKNLKDPDKFIIKELYFHSKLPHIAKVIIETLFGDWVL